MPASTRREFEQRKRHWLGRICSEHDLPAAAFKVAYSLGCRFNLGHGGAAWPSQAVLARECGMAERTLRDATAALQSAGYLRKKRGGQGETTRYWMRFPEHAGDDS